MGAAELEMLSDASDTSVEDATQAAVSGIPLGRLGTADDVAEVVAWLVSSAAYVTGTIIPIDGGSGR
nr:hypothetical protein ISGA_07560 [Gordonia sp. NB41Y]